MNKIKKIGLFDSGLGGLSILKALLQRFPNKDFVYFADTLNLPYGEKTNEELKKCCLKVKDFLLSVNAEALVAACNAASCLYLDKKSYKNTPLINVISPTIKKLMEVSSNNETVGVLATPFTVKSNVYPLQIHSLKPQLKVFQKSAPDLAPLVEKDRKGQECRTALRKNLEPLLEKNINILVLACTHYFFLKEEIHQIVPPHIKIVDPLDWFTAQNGAQEQANSGDSKPQNKRKTEENITESQGTLHLYMTQEQPEIVKAVRQIAKGCTLPSPPQITLLNSF